MKTKFDGEVFYALNELVIQRLYEDSPEKILRVDVAINKEYVDRLDGDGVIVSTPTGSTAYSLSAGGSILSPDINAFSMTPICAHSLHNRPLVFSADSICEITLKSNNCGIFFDGNLIQKLHKDDVITIHKSNKTIKFLRKKDSNFYTRLLTKLKK
jgi:NAD+ kinase